MRVWSLHPRYLDPVEHDKARTSGHTYLTERWAFAPDEKLETGRYLILGKRPEYKGKPRADLVTGGPRSRLLRLVKTSSLWQDSVFATETKHWKDTEWVELVQDLLHAASNCYVQKYAIDTDLAGWRLNAAALDWCLTAEQPQDENSRINTFFRELYLSIADLLRFDIIAIVGRNKDEAEIEHVKDAFNPCLVY